MMPDGHHPGFIESFGYAIDGLKAVVRRERNIKVMLGAAVFAVVMGIIVRIDALSWAIVVICIAMVLGGELLNSAIEAVVDLASPQVHPLAKLAKDYACAGVYVLSIASAIAGCIIYIRALIALMAG